jgi:hypothetical protein
VSRITRRRRPRGSGAGTRAPAGPSTAPPCATPLDEETLVAAALRAEEPLHARECPHCAARLRAAAAVLHSDGVESAASRAARRAVLEPLLEAAIDAEQRPARVHVTLAGENHEMAFRGEGLEFRFRDPAAPALRRDGSASAPLTFRRRFGPVEVRFQLLPEGPGFRLVVETEGALPERAEIALRRDGREIASERVREVPTHFPRLLPGRYELVVRRGGVTLARADIEVEAAAGGPARGQGTT